MSRKMLLIAMMMGITIVCSAQFAGGSGTEQDPWIVETAHHLNNLRNYLGEEHGDKHFLQRADIDLGVPPWNQGDGWRPIGWHVEPFMGNYDGNNHKIMNMTTDRLFYGFHIGLFGETENAILRRIRLVDVSVKCGVQSGGLVGWAETTTIVDCSVTGMIYGTEGIGGLAGVINNNSSVTGSYTAGSLIIRFGQELCYAGGITGALQNSSLTDSYSSMSVLATRDLVGGLVGLNHHSNISDCYSTGPVDVQAEGGSVGGLIGGANGGNVTNSFWNTQTSGRNQSAGGEGLSTEQMVTRANYVNNNWDFDDVWRIEDGFTYPYQAYQETYSGYNIPGPFSLTVTANHVAQSITLNWSVSGTPDYYNIYRNERIIDTVNHPVLQYRDNNPQPLIDYEYYVSAIYIEEDDVQMETGISNIQTARLNADFTQGDGSADNPYQVNSPATLSLVREHLDSHFIQTADIDLGVPPWNEGQGWIAIGHIGNQPFTGHYNGNGYNISGLTINRTGMFAALFGNTQDAVIRNVGLQDVNITGFYYVGGIVSRALSNTKIQGCYVSGVIRGNSTIGSIVSLLQGENPYSEVLDCYSTAVIINTNPNGDRNTGGIIGFKRDGNVMKNYFSGAIYFDNIGYESGAVIGHSFQNRGTVAHNYWNSETTFCSHGGPEVGEGNTTEQMMQSQTYTGFNFNTVWNIENGASYPFLRWEAEQAQEHNRPALMPPVNLRGTGGADTVSLFWDDPPPEFGIPDGYNVYRNDVRVNQEVITEREYEDRELQPFIEYHYQVSAIYEGRESLLTRKIGVSTSLFAGGDGTTENPFLIETAEQFNGTRLFPDSHFRQIDDIDLGIPPWNEGEGWEPIPSFSGSFNGNGFQISGLTITSEGDTGLIMELNGSIKNLVLTDVNIEGGMNVAGITNFMTGGSISNSILTGKISGMENVGGFVSRFRGGTIENSINAAHITAGDFYVSYIGGFAANVEFPRDEPFITNSYNIGKLTGTGNYSHIGAIIGRGAQANVTDCYWNSETTGIDNSQTGIPKTSLEMTQQETFEGWDFNEVWSIGYQNAETYPWLRIHSEPLLEQYYLQTQLQAWLTATGNVNLTWSSPDNFEIDEYRIYRDNEHIRSVSSNVNTYQDDDTVAGTAFSYKVMPTVSGHEFNPSNTVLIAPVPEGFVGGKGTVSDPYKVALANQLRSVGYNPSRHYILIQDINIPQHFIWIPIGDSEAPFTGSFDGKGHVIDNLVINRPNQDFVGMFGAVEDGAIIRNITLTNLSITANRGAGGIAAVLSENSLLVNCHVTGEITCTGTVPNDYAGGLVGYNDLSNIHNSSFRGKVTANNNYVGGLAGYNFNGSIYNSYSISDVSGRSYIGGFIGYNRGSIKNSFSRGTVSGDSDYIGGFIGNNAGASIEDSYSAVEIDVSYVAPTVGGFIGSMTSGEIDDSYWDTELAGILASAGGIGRTTEQMTYPYDGDTYAGWDFEDFWVVDVTGEDNDGYPFLLQRTVPYPNIAVNPNPEDGETFVSLDLERLSWEYISTQHYTDPAGFRVYLNQTGDFHDNHDYIWIDYDTGQTVYYCYDILPEKLEEQSTYYWRVVPTAGEHDERAAEGRGQRAESLEQKAWGGDQDVKTPPLRNIETLQRHNPLVRGDAGNVPIWSFSTFDPSSADDDIVMPLITKLHANYPNPFNPETTISFSLAEASEVTIEIFNIRGQRVVKLFDEYKEAGIHRVIWNSRDSSGRTVGSGVYFYRMKTKDYLETERMILIK